MNSLVSYGSDDELDDSSEEKSMDSYGAAGRNYRKPASQQQQTDDTNYDEVQMSCSEDSDAETRSPSKHNRDRDDGRRASPKAREVVKDPSQRDRREDRWDKTERHSGKDRSEDRSRYRDDDRSKHRDDKDDRSKYRDDDRGRDRADRYRDDDKSRDRRDDEKSRDRRDDEKSRDRRDDDKSRDRRDDRRDRYSSRDDRYRQDRERRRSRSPRDSRDRERRRSRSPRRSRSRSRSREANRGFQRRFERINRTEKYIIDQKISLQPQPNEDAQNTDRFFMPGITGRFRDQIEKRKLLWQKKEPEAAPVGAIPVQQPSDAPRATKVWESTTFAQDTDGKVANKFKRLMGIKTPTDANKTAGEVLKKQDEMFSAMEQQYEVARTTTHTMRGVGLGFSSYNR